MPLLRRLFSDEQACLGAALGRDYEGPSVIAARLGDPVERVAGRLDEMEALELVLTRETEGGRTYRLVQFVDGIFELNIGRFDRELAQLFEAYMNDGGARLLMGQPAYARVLPGEHAASSEWILPFDDVRSILEQTRHIVLAECSCRTERGLVGAPCRFPLRVCLSLYADEPSAAEGEVISVERALRVLEECEEAGLVHTVSNVRGGWTWLCNCCSCCCEWLRGYTEWQIDTAVVRNYRVTLDEVACSGCGACEGRCQVAAIALAGELAEVRRETCIGCGLCVTTCPTGALRLERLPEPEITLPPQDHRSWEDGRSAGTIASQ